MVGIKETKEVIALGIHISQGIELSLADNEWTISDAFNFFQALQATPAAIMDIDHVPQELLDLDETELAEIEALVKEIIPGVKDEWLQIARNALKIVMAAKEIYDLVKNLRG
jgi:hypothetical protein